MHSDLTSIELRAAERASLAEQMAAYERQHGPIQTAPIISRGPQIRYNNRSVEKERAAASARGRAKQLKRPAGAQAKPAQDHPTPSPGGTRQSRARAVLREEWP